MRSDRMARPMRKSMTMIRSGAPRSFETSMFAETIGDATYGEGSRSGVSIRKWPESAHGASNAGTDVRGRVEEYISRVDHAGDVTTLPELAPQLRGQPFVEEQLPIALGQVVDVARRH